jgi:hypothetical protein
VPVPPGRPCAQDSDVIPVLGAIAFFGEHKAALVKPCLSVHIFENISYENGHDSPWETIIQDEKVIAFSYYS